MGGQWCFNYGEDKPIKYEAFYTPSDSGGTPLHLVVCEGGGRDMDAQKFGQLAMANLPSDGGTVDLVNHPADQVDRDGKLPENQ